MMSASSIASSIEVFTNSVLSFRFGLLVREPLKQLLTPTPLKSRTLQLLLRSMNQSPTTRLRPSSILIIANESSNPFEDAQGKSWHGK